MNPKTIFIMKKLFLLIFLTAITICSKATIVVPPANLAEMAYNADLVIYATAESHQNGNSYINNFRVLEVIKGDVSANDIVVVEEYSGTYGGRPMVISGDVDFKLNFNYVLFLSEVGTGNYKARQLSMGVFEEGNMADQYVLGRNGSMLDLVLSGSTAYDYNELTGLYLTTEFVDHMTAVMNNTTSWNYMDAGFVTYNNTGTGSNGMPLPPSLEKAGPCPNDAPCHCATLFGPPGMSQTKYVDNTWTVCVAGGAQDDPSTTTEIADLQTAITAMNGMQGINISYTGVDAACMPASGCAAASGETLTCAGGFGSNCNKMFVFFDDPCNEIADVAADCSGTLGIGGHFAGGNHVDDCGDSWQTACNPFFVMNNFGVCAPSTVNQNDYIAILIHEMLHAVGVGHHYNATAFTTTAAGDNACGTGAITHDQTECTGVMNPVVCSTTPPSASNGYSISSLDNACTDWMYNITPATTCLIENVTLTAPAVCNGDNPEFEVCFDVTDGGGAYDIEVGGQVVVDAAAGATDGNICIMVSVTGPTAASTVTVDVRDDATFSCVSATNLQVALPQCPLPCASTCADLMSATAGDCGNNYYPDSNTYPGAGTTSTNVGDGTGNCQNYGAAPVVLPAGSGASHTICTEYTAGSDAAAFVDFIFAGDPNCINQSIILYEAATCTDASTLPGVTVTQPGGGYAGQATGLTGNTDYIICFTYTENACADDFSGSIFEICPDIIEIGNPACFSMPDVILPTDICNGDDVPIDFGPNCVANPDLGANSGYAVLLYLDANNIPTTFPIGSNFTFDDLLNGVDPNLIFVAVNSGGCTDLDYPLGIVNGTCDPIDVSIGIMPIDVEENFSFNDCPIEEYTLTVHPNYDVVEDITNGCNPIAGAFASDGAGNFFDTNGDGDITFADACFTAQLDPTDDCTDAATLDYDFTTDIDAANPTCYTNLTGTLTCDCTTLICTAVAEPDMPQACAEADFQIDVNTTGGCTTDPTFDDAAIFGPGAVSGYIAFYYSTDGGVTFEACPAGFTGNDILIDPNVVFFGESNAANGGACSPVDIGAILNNTCTPIDVPVCLVNGDVTNFFVAFDSNNDGTNDFTCDVVNTTATIYPNLMAMIASEDPANCGNTVANLIAGDNSTVCATETIPCAADGDLPTTTFTTLTDGTPIADPLTCATLTATSTTACTGCTTIDITDPCSCDAGIDICGGTISTPPGNIDVNGDNIITGNGIDLVADVIEITVNPPVAGQTYMIGTTTGDAGLALDCSGTPLPEGTAMTETAPGSGVYQLIVYYPADGTGFGTINFTSNTGSPQSITSAAPTYPPCECEVICGITVMVDNMCDDKGTDDEGDDEVTFFVTVLSNGDPLATTWEDGTLTGQAYDVAVMYGPLPADDTQFLLTITDETNPICTLTVNEIKDCSTLENIPTVGEWGLIILGLLMSIIAIIGIRQKQMTIVYQVKK